MTTRPPLFSPYDAPLWDSIRDGALRLQRCTVNGAFRFPPGPVGPDTRSPEFTWEPVSGRATLLSWTTFHRQYLPGFPPPHTVALIRLAEGPVMAAIVPPDVVADLRVDAPLRLEYADGPDGHRLTAVRPDLLPPDLPQKDDPPL